jgi:hypothetical protein
MRNENRRESKSIKSDLARIDRTKDANIPPMDASFPKKATIAGSQFRARPRMARFLCPGGSL